MDIIRDPLWNNIRVDGVAIRLVDTPAFQRLRYIRQLGLAYLVYPGATHTRFEHALGAYHLCKLTLGLLRERDALRGIDDEECLVVSVAALLHDLGHYPFSHALEEIGAAHHEDVAEALLTSGDVGNVLRTAVATDAPERIAALVRGTSASPLQGLISGSLDLDKIEYLKRDAHMCGVPYGEIDADRLINSLVLAQAPETGLPVVAVAEKGLSALESLLFAKYQMYRNVYWHHAVRSATAMYKRIVDDACQSGALSTDQLQRFTDEQLLYYLESNAPSALLTALRTRRLYKRATQWPATDLDEAFDWIASDRRRVVATERVIAGELGLAPDEVLLDYPEKTQMLGLDIPIVRRNGAVERLTHRGLVGAINLPLLSQELYRSARWLRVFTVRDVVVDPRRMLELLEAA